MKTSISEKECFQLDEVYYEYAKKFYSDEQQRKKSRKIKNKEDMNSSSPNSVINNCEQSLNTNNVAINCEQSSNTPIPLVNCFFGEGTKVPLNSLSEIHDECNNVSDQIIQIISKKQKFTPKDIEIQINNTTEGNLAFKISLSAHFTGI